MRKRILSVMLIICMVLALMSQMAFADTVTGITYLDASGAQQTCDNATAVTGDDTTWGTDNETTWYVAQGDVTIESRVTVTGDVHLILADGCNLTVNGGIYVSSWTASKLTIYGQENGTGELYAYASSGSDYAGIGGNKEPYGTSGEITINGGNITAVGDGIGAGIGGGDMGGFECITINGGTVTATGGNNDGSSGIGTFEGGSTSGTITISGGTVMATGTNHGIDASFMGTISTGNDGHAVIFASYTNSMGSYFRYSSSQNRDSWRGVIFEGNSGQIYGDDITPSESFEIPSGKTLEIDGGKSLTIPAGKTLTVNGTLTNNGKLYVDGTLNGTVNGNGDVYYNLAPTDCTVSSTGIEKHNEKTYAKEGSEITLTPDTPQVGYLFDSWEVSPESVQINNNNSFTMPKEALTVTAKWIECPHDGDKETRNAKEATCTEAGYSGDVYCLVCNEMITKGHDINMASHKLNYIPKTDATVTETGNDEYWQCTVCDKYFSDAAGTNEITDLESWKAGEGKIDKLIPPKTDYVTSDKDGNISVFIEKSITTNDGVTGVDITDTVSEAILSGLESSESKSVVITAVTRSSVSGPGAAKPGTSIQINLPESAVKKLAEVEGIKITIVTDNGSIVLDEGTLEAIASKSGDDGKATLAIDTVEQTGSLLKLELTLKTSEGEISDFGSGSVEVTVAISDELKDRNPVCVYIDEHGIYHLIGGKLNEDGTFTFASGHFSTYAIMPEEDAEAVIKVQTADAQKEAIKGVKTSVSLTTKKVKKGIKVNVKVPASKKADKTGVIIYRSQKKSSGYVLYKKVRTSGSSYTVTNTKNLKGKRLTKGRKYYYKARAYKVIDGKTYYGPMSAVKYAKAR